jgi:hypothetical protein
MTVFLFYFVKRTITRDKKDLASGQVAFAACLLSAFHLSYVFVLTIYFVLSLSLFLATRVGILPDWVGDCNPFRKISLNLYPVTR